MEYKRTSFDSCSCRIAWRPSIHYTHGMVNTLGWISYAALNTTPFQRIEIEDHSDVPTSTFCIHISHLGFLSMWYSNISAVFAYTVMRQ